ncbi:hypothetical protein E2C01_007747 [Portunus trituberculatus]|uniref:Uncharacterized protein n=1 Tax=Portunus trituberculatus TaxID=210409 RepID=A0A5B7D376_PORTR|nr:hypothetical protein [Portunus trituberculatus]
MTLREWWQEEEEEDDYKEEGCAAPPPFVSPLLPYPHITLHTTSALRLPTSPFLAKPSLWPLLPVPSLPVPHNVCCGDQCARPLSATPAPHVCLCGAVVAKRRGGGGGVSWRCGVPWCVCLCRLMEAHLLL